MSDTDIGDELRLIADSAVEFARGAGGLARSRQVRDQWPRRDRGVWEQIVALGWLNLLVPERHDGMGLDVRAMCALQESVGRSLLPEPLAPAMAAAAFLADADHDVAAGLLSQLTAGERMVLPATQAADGGFPLRLRHVPDCHEDATLLLARVEGDGFEVRALAVGDILQAMADAVDGTVLGDILVTRDEWAQAPLAASGRAASVRWETMRDSILLGHCAYLAGAMRAALDLTLDYMKTRRQFGAPIGSFQALQHRAASVYMDCVASRALVYEACRAFGTDAFARAACMAKARVGASALRVTKECIQFHGAVGFADEHDIGLFLRKAMMLAARDGGELRQKLRLAAMSASESPRDPSTT